ncbi:hypothetical protein BDV29DRAFT_178251, partial [Aspergillus leporis]
MAFQSSILMINAVLVLLYPLWYIFIYYFLSYFLMRSSLESHCLLKMVKLVTSRKKQAWERSQFLSLRSLEMTIFNASLRPLLQTI